MAFCSQCGAQLSEQAKFCPGCGTATDPGASGASPAATGPQNRPDATTAHAVNAIAPPGGGGARLILPLIAIVAIAIIGFVLWSQRDGTQPIATADRQQVATDRETASASTGTDEDGATTATSVDRANAAVDTARAGIVGELTATSAAVLDSAFYRDPQGAALRYAGPLRVSGVIATMVTPGSTPSLSLEGRSRLNFMIVNFPAGYRERLAPLSKGQFITVDCAEVRSLGGTTILSGCTLG